MPKQSAQIPKGIQVRLEKDRAYTVASMRYIMENMPEPCISNTSIEYKPHKWPAKRSLTKGRKLTPREVQMMTLAIMNRNGTNSLRADQPFAHPLSLYRALVPYLPKGVRIPNTGACWSNFLKDNANSPEIMEAAEEFTEFTDTFIRKIETQLTVGYINGGHKTNQAYLEVLSRKFKQGWSNSASMKFEAKTEVPGGITASSEGVEEAPAEAKSNSTTVSFVFETVHPEGGADAH